MARFSSLLKFMCFRGMDDEEPSTEGHETQFETGCGSSHGRGEAKTKGGHRAVNSSYELRHIELCWRPLLSLSRCVLNGVVFSS
jgi:hypothetical protein